MVHLEIDRKTLWRSLSPYYMKICANIDVKTCIFGVRRRHRSNRTLGSSSTLPKLSTTDCRLSLQVCSKILTRMASAREVHNAARSCRA
jgi:hypothetical protein